VDVGSGSGSSEVSVGDGEEVSDGVGDSGVGSGEYGLLDR
jgi:hypothetical protein